MKTVRAFWITAVASALYLAGRISDAECERRINRARIMLGRPVIGRHSRRDP